MNQKKTKLTALFFFTLLQWNCAFVMGSVENSKDKAKTNLSLWPLALTGVMNTGSEASTNSQFTVSGVVSGLTQTGLALQLNKGNDLNIPTNGSFLFDKSLSSGKSYEISILTNPNEQNCTIANGSGFISNHITNINIICTDTGKVATPIFSPTQGAFNSDQSISISTTSSNAIIYYTIDGSIPNQSSTQYTTGSTISISGNGTSSTIKAFAVKSGKMDSDINTATYTVNYDTVATPIFNLTPGTFNADQLVTITTNTAGATIYYTTNGSTPTSSSTQYNGTPVSISGHNTNKTVKAIAIKNGMLNSAIETGVYSISYNTVATPTFSINPGTYNSDQAITMSTITVGATIYYTTNGSTPTTASTQYTGAAILISGHGTNTTIKAIAVKSGMLDSAIFSGAFVISYDSVASPVFNVPSGTYPGDQTITISTTTAGATIYYTTNGSTPSTSSTQYTGTSILVTGNTTIKALAVKSGMLDSQTSAIYTISSLTIGGTVTDLTGTLTLRNNGTDDKIISSNGSYLFAALQATGSTYTVTIKTQPAGQNCALYNATGTASANVININVACYNLNNCVAGCGTCTGFSAGQCTGWCHASCRTCTSPASNQCIDCPNLNFYLSGGECRSCHFSCTNGCRGSGASDCL